ncbi:hypothetical protein SAMN05216345_10892 [Cupriavidus sp. YR651]|uniref:hypothetical protein n=1 Tax=Cupriavidus sp. YR651 TaxID=1855315 RepID=UPI00088F9BE3|nr:hypothetical protein [Cupriavidus sp. YR651]SDD35943.1 hypothetical protein SAMN05216345_10892 [Cupriavidus sp. YR651]
MGLSRNFVWDVMLAASLLLIVGYCHAISFVGSPLLLISTLVLATVVIMHWCLHTRERFPSLADASVLLFEILFLVVAPAVQRAYFDLELVNTSTLNEGFAVATNLLCTLFVLVYVGTRCYGARRDRRNRRGPYAAYAARRGPPPAVVVQHRLTTPRALVLVGVACVAVVLSLQAIDIRTQSEMIEATPQYLIQQKYLCFLPVPMLLMLVNVKGRQLFRQPLWLLLAVFFLVCVFVSQNPLIEKRNTIGPVYLSLLLLALPWFSRTSRRQATTLLLLIGVCFPLASVFTHADLASWNVTEVLDPWLYFSHFLDLHYDAWANIHTVIEMVNRDGLRLGEQLLGSVLFFVPHLLWEAKPHATGIEIGQFLMAFHKLDFDNLSAPLIAEGYIDFSVAGVAMAAVALAMLTRFLDRLCVSASPVGKPAGIYFSVFLVFLLRGALMIAIAYGTATAVAFLTINWFVSRRRARHAQGVRRMPRAAPARQPL